MTWALAHYRRGLPDHLRVCDECNHTRGGREVITTTHWDGSARFTCRDAMECQGDRARGHHNPFGILLPGGRPGQDALAPLTHLPALHPHPFHYMDQYLRLEQQKVYLHCQRCERRKHVWHMVQPRARHGGVHAQLPYYLCHDAIDCGAAREAMVATADPVFTLDPSDPPATSHILDFHRFPPKATCAGCGL